MWQSFRHLIMWLTVRISSVRWQDIEEELEERVKEFKRDDKLLEAQRIAERTNFDIEMLKETGFCSGIENYSRHLAGLRPGQAPYTLIDYFPDDFIMMIDESHKTIPQIGGMYARRPVEESRHW